MAQPDQTASEAVNADSFLDIVASVVSIMIIMVVMIGLKIRHSPVDVPPPDLSIQAGRAAPAEQRSEDAARGEALKVQGDLEALQRKVSSRQEECAALARSLASLEEKSQAARRDIDAQSEQDDTTARQLAQSQARLGELEQERRAAETAPGPSVQIECYPTPLSRDVDGRETHFLLRGGRVAAIPLDSLVEQLKADARRKIDRLRDVPEFSETIGPVAGFRIRYTIERVDPTPDRAKAAGRGGTFAQLRRWTLVCESADLGEPVERALGEGSQFRRALANPLARQSTITIWTYPDSFDAFRQIKKELYRMEFAVAARPLPEGVPISGSPDGSKSAAE